MKIIAALTIYFAAVIAIGCETKDQQRERQSVIQLNTFKFDNNIYTREPTKCIKVGNRIKGCNFLLKLEGDEN